MSTERFGVGTMNIPASNGQAGDLPFPVVVSIAKEAENQVGLLATQETIEPEDNRALDAALPPVRWWHFTEASENDLLVKRARWRPCPPERLPRGVSQVGRRSLSRGRQGVSPGRDLPHVVLEWVNQPTWSPFVFAGTHLIVVKKDAELAFRQAARAEEMDGLQDNAAYWVDRGLNTILALDSNWGAMPKLIPSWVWDVQGGKNGIDKIGHANAPASNWALSFVNRETYANASDHDFQVANMMAMGKPTQSATIPELHTTMAKVEAWLGTTRGRYNTVQADALRTIARAAKP